MKSKIEQWDGETLLVIAILAIVFGTPIINLLGLWDTLLANIFCGLALLFMLIGGWKRWHESPSNKNIK